MSEIVPVGRKTKKRTFLGLLLAAMLFLLFTALYLLLAASDRYAAFSRSVFMGLTISALLVNLLFSLGLLAIVLTILQNEPFLIAVVDRKPCSCSILCPANGALYAYCQEKIQRSLSKSTTSWLKPVPCK